MRTFYSVDDFLSAVFDLLVSCGKLSKETVAHSLNIPQDSADLALDMLKDQGRVFQIETPNELGHGWFAPIVQQVM